MSETIVRGIEELESKQGRFSADGQTLYNGFVSLQPLLSEIPPYRPNSRRRDRWLAANWHKVDIWAGMLRQEAALNANRRWTMTGGALTVNRARRAIQNSWVAADVNGYRPMMTVETLSYHTSDLGSVIETARFDNAKPGGYGTLAGFLSVDSTQCHLTGRWDAPLAYRGEHWDDGDYWRVASLINPQEAYRGLGMCSTSLAVDTLATLYLVHRYDRGELDPASMDGLVLMGGIGNEQLQTALSVREATAPDTFGRFFRRLGVIANDDPDMMPQIKVQMLQSLPKRLEQPQVFMEICISTLALLLGRNPSEYWPINDAPLTSSSQHELRQQQSTYKAGNEYLKMRQDKLNDPVVGLPRSVHLEYEERDDEGRLAHAQILNTYAEFGTKMNQPSAEDGKPLMNREQIMKVMVEEARLNPAYTTADDDAQATDERDAARSLERAMLIERVELHVERCIQRGRNERIVRYAWPEDRTETVARIVNGELCDASGKPVGRTWQVDRAVSDQGSVVSRATLFDDGDVAITSADVDAAIEGAGERVGAEWAQLMTAEVGDDE